MTHEGTDERRTLSSKRDRSKKSALLAAALCTLSWTKRHSSGWTDGHPLIVSGGFSRVSCWPCAAKLKMAFRVPVPVDALCI